MEVNKDTLVSLDLNQINNIKSSLLDKIESKKEELKSQRENRVNQVNNVMRVEDSNSDTEVYENELEIIFGLENEETENGSQELIDLYITLNKLENTAVYRKNEILSHKVYQLSIVSTVIGFAFILIAAIYFFENANTDRPFAASLSALVIIPNLIAGLLFVLHQRTTEKSNILFNRVDEFLDLELANLYVNGFENPEDKIELKKEIVKRILAKGDK